MDQQVTERVGFAKLANNQFEYYIKKYEVVIGRKTKSQETDVHIGESSTISRQHAKITYNFSKGYFELTSLNKKGCVVGDKQQGSDDPPIRLESKVKIQIGGEKFVFLLPLISQKPQLKIDDTNPKHTAKKSNVQKQIIGDKKMENNQVEGQNQPKKLNVNKNVQLQLPNSIQNEEQNFLQNQDLPQKINSWINQNQNQQLLPNDQINAQEPFLPQYQQQQQYDQQQQAPVPQINIQNISNLQQEAQPQLQPATKGKKRQSNTQGKRQPAKNKKSRALDTNNAQLQLSNQEAENLNAQDQSQGMDQGLAQDLSQVQGQDLQNINGIPQNPNDQIMKLLYDTGGKQNMDLANLSRNQGQDVQNLQYNNIRQGQNLLSQGQNNIDIGQKGQEGLDLDAFFKQNIGKKQQALKNEPNTQNFQQQIAEILQSQLQGQNSNHDAGVDFNQGSFNSEQNNDPQFLLEQLGLNTKNDNYKAPRNVDQRNLQNQTNKSKQNSLYQDPQYVFQQFQNQQAAKRQKQGMPTDAWNQSQHQQKFINNLSFPQENQDQQDLNQQFQKSIGMRQNQQGIPQQYIDKDEALRKFQQPIQRNQTQQNFKNNFMNQLMQENPQAFRDQYQGQQNISSKNQPQISQQQFQDYLKFIQDQQNTSQTQNLYKKQPNENYRKNDSYGQPNFNLSQQLLQQSQALQPQQYLSNQNNNRQFNLESLKMAQDISGVKYSQPNFQQGSQFMDNQHQPNFPQNF